MMKQNCGGKTLFFIFISIGILIVSTSFVVGHVESNICYSTEINNNVNFGSIQSIESRINLNDNGIETVIDHLNISHGLPMLKTTDLPKTEKNRINQTQEWYYQDRGLKQPPLDWHLDTTILDKDEIYSLGFGLIKGMTVSIYLDVSQYLNGNSISTDYRGDLDLMLYKDGDAIPLATSTNDEGSDEYLDYEATEEANFTLIVLHDSRDSSHPYGSGYLKLTSQLYSNYFAYSYFEGRNSTNQPTDYSTWYFYSGQNLHTFGVTVDESIDFYQLRINSDVYSDISTDAQTWGVDMNLSLSNDYYHEVEIEAEWGSGFALISALNTTTYVDQLMTSQKSFPSAMDPNEIYIQMARASYNGENGWLSDHIIDGSNYLGIYNLSLNKYMNNFSDEFTLNSYSASDYVPPSFLKSGIRGPSQLGVYQFYTDVSDLSGANAKISLLYSTDNSSFTKIPLQWIVDQYYGTALSFSTELENIYWYVQVEQDYPSSVNPPTEPRSLMANFNLINDRVTLSWALPNDDGGMPIMGYYVYEKTVEMDHWNVYQVNQTTITWSNNLPNLYTTSPPNWEYGVIAYNGVGNSTLVTIKSDFRKPGIINNLAFEFDEEWDNIIRITWDPPNDLGYPEVSEYSIIISPTTDIADGFESNRISGTTFEDWYISEYKGRERIFYFVAALNDFGGTYKMVEVDLSLIVSDTSPVETSNSNFPMMGIIIIPIIIKLKKIRRMK